MIRPWQNVAPLLAALFLGAGQARAPQASATLTLIAQDGNRQTLSLQDLLALPQVEIVAPAPNNPQARFKGPTLRALLTTAGAPEGHALRGPSMQLAVMAEARDGYRVVYSLAELDPQFSHRQAIVALSYDGDPLPADEGPFRIILQGDQHHARWIRQLTTLRILRVGP